MYRLFSLSNLRCASEIETVVDGDEGKEDEDKGEEMMRREKGDIRYACKHVASKYTITGHMLSNIPKRDWTFICCLRVHMSKKIYQNKRG